MVKIYYVDALAGSGKTHAATAHAHRLTQQDHKVLIVQPSVLLIQQAHAGLAALYPVIPIKAIYGTGLHGPGTSINIVGDIVSYFREVKPEGQVLIMTHAEFLRLPYIHRRDYWHLLIDEVPQADWCDELSLAETHALITNSLEVEADENGRVGNLYALVTPQEPQPSSVEGHATQQAWR